MSFLDKEGLRYFWQGAKKKFYNKSEIDSQREELQKGIDDASKTGGVEVGAVIGYTGEGTPEGYDEVKRGYSTEEILTGETWTDGKPVYIKTFKGILPAPDINGTNWVNVITNASSLISVSGTVGARPYNNDIVLRNGDYVLALDIAIAGNTIMYRNLGIAKDTAFEITIKYTKTTDTGNFKYIEKKSVTPIEPKTGHIYDTTNIDNKAENTYSANVIDGLIGENVTNSTGWNAITDSKGQALYKYRKTGKIVEVQIAIWRDNADFKITAGGSVTIGNLPENCRPSTNLSAPALVVNSDKSVPSLVDVRITTDGSVMLRNWYNALNCVLVVGAISYVV